MVASLDSIAGPRKATNADAGRGGWASLLIDDKPLPPKPPPAVSSVQYDWALPLVSGPSYYLTCYCIIHIHVGVWLLYDDRTSFNSLGCKS